MTTYTNGHTNHNGNGSRPRLSDSYAAEARAYIHRYEPNPADMLEWLDKLMALDMPECVRCQTIRERILDIYAQADAEALFGGEA